MMEFPKMHIQKCVKNKQIESKLPSSAGLCCRGGIKRWISLLRLLQRKQSGSRSVLPLLSVSCHRCQSLVTGSTKDASSQSHRSQVGLGALIVHAFLSPGRVELQREVITRGDLLPAGSLLGKKKTAPKTRLHKRCKEFSSLFSVKANRNSP